VTVGVDEARSESSPQAGPAVGASWSWLALGASIGGPSALRELLAELPSPLPLRVVVVQHIAHGLGDDFAAWLAATLGLDVRPAMDGERPPSGAVRVAPSGAHLRVTPDGRLALDTATPAQGGHRPSIDELFLSLATTFPGATVAALLSGTGNDGARGLLALRRAGGFCLVQDEESSAARGMPHAAIVLGAAELALPPRALGLELALRLSMRAE